MIGIALVGVGYWGPKLLRALGRTEGAEVRWVVDANPASGEVVRQTGFDKRFTTDFSEALADPEVQAVVIATPAGTHYELVRKALESGKHVLVEKPLTDVSSSARELVDSAKNRGLVLMVGHTYLFNSGIVRIKKIIQSGELGEVLGMRFSRTNLGIVRPDVNVGWDLAVHDVAISNWLVGAAPAAVSAIGSSWINPPAFDVLNSKLTYPGGISSEIHVSWFAPEKQRKIWVLGSKKMLVFDDTKQNDSIQVFDMGVDSSTSDYRGTQLRLTHYERGSEHPEFVWQEPLLDECTAFLSSIQSGIALKSDGDFGVEVMKTLEAIDASANNGGAKEELAW